MLRHFRVTIDAHKDLSHEELADYIATAVDRWAKNRGDIKSELHRTKTRRIVYGKKQAQGGNGCTVITYER